MFFKLVGPVAEWFRRVPSKDETPVQAWPGPIAVEGWRSGLSRPIWNRVAQRTSGPAGSKPASAANSVHRETF